MNEQAPSAAIADLTREMIDLIAADLALRGTHTVTLTATATADAWSDGDTLHFHIGIDALANWSRHALVGRIAQLLFDVPRENGWPNRLRARASAFFARIAPRPAGVSPGSHARYRFAHQRARLAHANALRSDAWLSHRGYGLPLAAYLQQTRDTYPVVPADIDARVARLLDAGGSSDIVSLIAPLTAAIAAEMPTHDLEAAPSEPPSSSARLRSHAFARRYVACDDAHEVTTSVDDPVDSELDLDTSDSNRFSD